MKLEISKTTLNLLIAIAFANNLITGLYDYLRSILFSGIQEEYNMSSDSLALIISIIGYAQMVYSFVLTLLLNYMSAKLMLILSMCIWIVISIGLYFTFNLTLTIVELFIFWIGISLIMIGTNVLFTKVFQKNNFLIVGLSNFFYGLGGVISPFIYQPILSNEGNTYRLVYLIYTIPAFLLLLFIIFTKFNYKLIDEDSEKDKELKEINTVSNSEIVNTMDTKKKSDSTHKKKTNQFSCFLLPMFWIMLFIVVCYQQLHYMIIDWSLNYLEKAFNWEKTGKCALFLQIYSISFCVGRGLFSFVGLKLDQYTCMYILFIGACLFATVGFLTGEIGNYIIACIGFFVGPAYASGLSLMIYIWSDADSTTITSMIITFYGLFKELVNYLIGLVNTYAGDEWGYRIMLPLTYIELILLIISHILYNHTHKSHITKIQTTEIASKENVKDIKSNELNTINPILNSTIQNQENTLNSNVSIHTIENHIVDDTCNPNKTVDN